MLLKETISFLIAKEISWDDLTFKILEFFLPTTPRIFQLFEKV